MKTSELTGIVLDWAVCKAGNGAKNIWLWIDGHSLLDMFHYSTNWSQGGPIIEREKITIEWTGENWMAYIWHDKEEFGPTPLIAAMRYYVASKLGDEVEVPKELTT